MSLREYIAAHKNALTTPAFYFDCDVFEDRINKVAECLGDIPLTFSIKANPFLLECIPERIAHVEVCSPGELKLCARYGISGEKIIYSGVNKDYEDVRAAMLYGADIITAESIKHVKVINEVAKEILKESDDDADCKRVRVILRLSSGNQFGMSEEDIGKIIENAESYVNLQIMGIHYFSGTQKSISNIEKDIKHLDAFLLQLRDRYEYEPEFVELGLGLKAEYYNAPCEDADMAMLREAESLVKDFATRVTLGIELGRFLAAPCGTYLTRVCDIKSNKGGNYVICDGGINHLVYYGQNMAMKIPEMEAITFGEQKVAFTALSDGQGVREKYCICGSLCTVADVLVRAVELEKLGIGDIIAFHRCGAYAVTEGNALFLSRQLPQVYLYSNALGLSLRRDFIYADEINCRQE